MRLILFGIGLLLLSSSGVWAKESIKPATVSPTPVILSDYTLPYPGLLPDHPLYNLKALRDKILLWFTKDEVKLVELNPLISHKKIKFNQLYLIFSKPEKYFII